MYSTGINSNNNVHYTVTLKTRTKNLESFHCKEMTIAQEKYASTGRHGRACLNVSTRQTEAGESPQVRG